ncbi:MAG: cytochrome c [Thiolinea sp.]
MKTFGFFLFGLGLASVLLIGCGDKNESAQPQTQTATEADTAVNTNTEAKTDQVAGKAKAATVADLDVHPGKSLHASNCISCHDSGVYTREDRKINDFPKLLAQVRRCDANLGSRLFDEEIEQVADYLNQAYYKFGK